MKRWLVWIGAVGVVVIAVGAWQTVRFQRSVKEHSARPPVPPGELALIGKEVGPRGPTEEELLEMTGRALESDDPVAWLLRQLPPGVEGYLPAYCKRRLEPVFGVRAGKAVDAFLKGPGQRSEGRPEMIERAQREGGSSAPARPGDGGRSQADRALVALWLFAVRAPDWGPEEQADECLRQIQFGISARDYCGAKTLWASIMISPLRRILTEGRREALFGALKRMAALAVEEGKFPSPEPWVPIKDVLDMLHSLDDPKGAEILEGLYSSYAVREREEGELNRNDLERHRMFDGVWGDASALWWRLKAKALSPEQLTDLLAQCRLAAADYNERSWRRLGLLNLEAAIQVIGAACLGVVREMAGDPKVVHVTMRHDVIMALGRFKDPEGPRILRGVVADKAEHPLYRTLAAAALGYFGEQLLKEEPSGREGMEAILGLFRQGIQSNNSGLTMYADCCLLRYYGNKGLSLPKEDEEFLRKDAGGRVEPAPGGTSPAELAGGILKAFQPVSPKGFRK